MRILKTFAFVLAVLTTTIKTSEAPAKQDAPTDAAASPNPAPEAGKPPAEGEPPAEIEVARCSKALLEAYDIESGWSTVKDQNFLCPSVKKFNCCSYHGQLDIYRKWILKGEKKNIVDHYRLGFLLS